MLDEYEIIRLCIWDTNGMEKFKSLTPNHYRDADACIFVFDMANHQTFKDICEYWYQQVMNYCQENIVLCMIGNKIDLLQQTEEDDHGGDNSKKIRKESS